MRLELRIWHILPIFLRSAAHVFQYAALLCSKESPNCTQVRSSKKAQEVFCG